MDRMGVGVLKTAAGSMGIAAVLSAAGYGVEATTR